MEDNLLLVFAQKSEAEATIRELKATPIEGETNHIWMEGHIPCCYRFDRGWIVLSNVGIHNGQMAVAKYGQKCAEVWNFGFAGALREGLTVGEIFSVERVGKFIPLESDSLDPGSQECLRFTVPQLTLEHLGGKLISSDFPVHDLKHKQNLGNHWDFVDMEGYGIAFASHSLGKKCKMWKVISDFASPGGREMIRKNKSALSEKIAQKILSLC